MTTRLARFADALLRARRWLLAVFALTTLLLGASATQLRVDASFDKLIPQHHPYMQVFDAYQKSFGSANRILLVLMQKHGSIYQPAFFKALHELSDAVFFLPGVDRASVTSLFTPNVRFTEIVEDGFVGGNVIPAGFSGTARELDAVRRNVLKSGQVGRLVANDFRGALVSAELLEFDPASGARLDYPRVAQQLEALRARFDRGGQTLHIIGFAKAVGDIRDGARGVLLFFALALGLTAVLLRAYLRSTRLAALALLAALTPVVWLLGLLPLLGYGIDPLSILVPFLIFAIGASHAVQMTAAWQREVLGGETSVGAARNAFLKLFVPGATALAANAIGFLVMLHIDIAMVREMALAASLGVGLMIVTNKCLLPVLLSCTTLDAASLARMRAVRRRPRFATRLAGVATRTGALPVFAVALALLAWGVVKGAQMQTGDLGRGIPELRADARYNADVAAVTRHFSIGVDMLGVVAETHGVADACTHYAIMSNIDRFAWEMSLLRGVQSVKSLPATARQINAGWNENSLKWRVLARDPRVLAQSIAPVETGSGLLDTDCSAMQVMIFTRDHRAATIATIVAAVKAYNAAHGSAALQFRLATGNVGVMAATNEAVAAAETSMLVSLFAAISLLVWWEFRTWRAVLCIMLPLALVSLLCNALMATLGIGLKVSTLPVIALGVGVGVDYGIYLYERMRHYVDERGESLQAAYVQALRERGSAIAFTALCMSLGTGLWAFSALKFQADMGVLLAFMFAVNLLGAVLLLPAIAAYLSRRAAPET